MDSCARCGRDVEDVHIISPDGITKELVDSVDHGEEDLASKGSIEVCAACMDELTGE